MHKLLILFFFMGILVTGVWAELDTLSLWLTVPLAALLFFFAEKGKEWIPNRVSFEFPKSSPTPKAFLVFAVVCLPLFVSVFATLNQEFPFSGDEYHHLLASDEAVYFWKKNILWLGLVLSLFFIFTKHLRFSFRVLIFYGVLFGWSYFVNLHQYFARYPGTFYFLNFPLHGLFNILSVNHPLASLQLTNLAAIVTWLWVLRPILIKKWPDISLLPFAFFFLFQKDHVMVLSSASLEPWATIMIFLALEICISEPSKLMACLCIGAAGLIKETYILLLPFVWLPIYLSKEKNSNLGKVAAGIFSVLPFMIYFLFRKHAGVARGYTLLSFPEIFQKDRIIEWLFRLRHQYEFFGLVGLGIVLCVSAFFIVRKKDLRLFGVSFFCFVLFQFGFFFADRISNGWIGYPRFNIAAYAVLGAPLFFMGQMLLEKKSKMPWVLTGLLLIANLFPLSKSITLAFKSDPSRNFLQHYDASVFYSFNTLLSKAEKHGDLIRVKQILINLPMGDAAKRAYPKWDRKFEFVFPYLKNRTEPVCECDSRQTAVFLPIIYKTGLLKDFTHSEGVETCVSKLKQSCNLFMQENGGALGLGAAY